MLPVLRTVLLAVTALAANAAFAGITFFEAPNFNGAAFTANGPVPDLNAVGFNDRPQSAIVDSGTWEVCLDARYNGGCIVLEPGQYPTLGAMSNLASSVRPMRGQARYGQRAYGGQGTARLRLFERENFSGAELDASGTVADFVLRGYNDRARSAIVEGGPFEVCVDVNFLGGCRILPPGQYPSLNDLTNRISSVRPAGSSLDVVPEPVESRRSRRDRPRDDRYYDRPRDDRYSDRPRR